MHFVGVAKPFIIYQGCWGWGGNIAGAAVSRTRVAVQSRGPGNTHREREVTYLSWAAPPYAYVCGCVLDNNNTIIIIEGLPLLSPNGILLLIAYFGLSIAALSYLGRSRTAFFAFLCPQFQGTKLICGN